MLRNNIGPDCREFKYYRNFQIYFPVESGSYTISFSFQATDSHKTVEMNHITNVST